MISFRDQARILQMCFVVHQRRRLPGILPATSAERCLDPIRFMKQFLRHQPLPLQAASRQRHAGKAMHLQDRQADEEHSRLLRQLHLR